MAWESAGLLEASGTWLELDQACVLSVLDLLILCYIMSGRYFLLLKYI